MFFRAFRETCTEPVEVSVYQNGFTPPNPKEPPNFSEGSMSRRKNTRRSRRSGLSAVLRRPAVQLGMVAFVALLIYLIASAGGGGTATLAREVSVDQAYQMYQDGVFVLDVRTQEEWDEYHAPNTTLIPLDQLPSRLNELPKEREIVVVCRSGNRSQEGRDILLAAGFNAASMTGGLREWYARGYPIEGAPAQ
jgi:rhodanese-related sulfurtransferase